jgi:hypothetical protein
LSDLERLLQPDDGQRPLPRPDRDAEWIAYVKLRREMAIQELRYCDQILVARGELRQFTLARRVR